MEIHPSARRHGMPVEHALAVEDVGEDPDRWLVIGPDTAGNLLEVVMLISAEGDELVNHAMPMWPAYRRFLKR